MSGTVGTLSNSAFASVSCSIEVYPFEGGPYIISGGQIKSISISKSIRGNSPGTFSIDLSPGGPKGVEDPNTWSKIITPMSHVIIGMARGNAQTIVMDGVATDTGESQQWSTSPQRGSTAARSQGISGNDFSWFFNTFSYYALTFYGLTAGTPVGVGLNLLPENLQSLIGQGAVGGTDSSQSGPVQVGRLWYRKVMGGQNSILGATYVNYKDNTKVLFTNAVATLWENYPEVFIPYADNFMVGMESWLDKFQSIFSQPWYECFVTTAPKGAYSLSTAAKATGFNDPGTQFGLQTMPSAVAAGPQFVARVNPFPKFDVTPTGNLNAVVKPGSIDVSRWNSLILYDFTKVGYGFYSSSVRFTASAAKNFYQLNPTSFSTLIGINNANNIPALFTFMAAADPASIERYGFRPYIGTTRWMFDAQGTAAQNKGLNIQNTVLQLTANYISWVHPEVLMATAEIIIPLNPTILAGNKFRYAPFKDGVPWDFYIEGFKHTYVFGGPSMTTLTLTRGLPTSVYQDTKDGGLLQSVCTGNAMRQDGVYTVGLPPNSAPALTFVSTYDQAAAFNQQLIQHYTTPQAGGVTPPPPA